MTGIDALPALPTTVISGYLGAGKTSLVNHMLRNPGGRRIMVMVNDFGALDIDADLLESADEDTVTLSNGCICCTMGTELMYALADACDRRPRPDCLVIEASGVAQPEKIAAAAHAEPEMQYSGVVTLADAANIAGLLDDAEIGAQIRGQLVVADLVVLTKTDLGRGDEARERIASVSAAPVIEAPHGAIDIDFLLEHPASIPATIPASVQVPGGADEAHNAMYASWHGTGGRLCRGALKALLSDPPEGLYRFKGRVELDTGDWAEAHLVGRTHALTPCAPAGQSRAVAIGLKGRFDPEAFEAVWQGCIASHVRAE